MNSLPFGDYASDPRIRVIDPLEVRAAGVRITSGNNLRWYVHDDGRGYAGSGGTLAECLERVLGDPAEVGPVGIYDWLHTDGRIYRHDPATTGMIPAENLNPGDVVDFPHLVAFEILGDAEITHNDLGQASMSYPVRRLDRSFDTRFTYRFGDMVPVRFAP